MARKCNVCGKKVGVFARKYWEMDSKGKREPLCAGCAATGRSQFDRYLLTNGYTRLEVHRILELGIWGPPDACAICGEPAPGKERSVRATSERLQGIYVNYTLSRCDRCAGLGLDPRKFVRLRIREKAASEVIFYEIGNEEVADIYKCGLEKGMEFYEERFKQQRDQTSGREKELWEQLGRGTQLLGLISSRRLKPGDKDWVQ